MCRWERDGVKREGTYTWNLAAMKGREKPKTRKVLTPMATGTLRVGPEGKGTDCVFIKRHKVVGSKISKTALADGNTFVLGEMGCNTYETAESNHRTASGRQHPR